jgi:hypothetical protein
MRTSPDRSALHWLAAQLRWERLLDDLRRSADDGDAPAPAVERPWAA